MTIKDKRRLAEPGLCRTKNAAEAPVLALLLEGSGLLWWYWGSLGSPKVLINQQTTLASGDFLSGRDSKGGGGGVNVIRLS